MKNKTRMRKLYTQYSLEWSLKIGDHLGTLDSQKAIKLANVKPVIFQRWIAGKLAAPASKLERIQYHAFATLKKKRRKVGNEDWITELDEEVIRARFLWKSMIFDQLSPVAKRRFCTGLKKLY